MGSLRGPRPLPSVAVCTSAATNSTWRRPASAARSRARASIGHRQIDAEHEAARRRRAPRARAWCRRSRSRGRARARRAPGRAAPARARRGDGSARRVAPGSRPRWGRPARSSTCVARGWLRSRGHSSAAITRSGSARSAGRDRRDQPVGIASDGAAGGGAPSACGAMPCDQLRGLLLATRLAQEPREEEARGGLLRALPQDVSEDGLGRARSRAARRRRCRAGCAGSRRGPPRRPPRARSRRGCASPKRAYWMASRMWSCGASGKRFAPSSKTASARSYSPSASQTSATRSTTAARSPPSLERELGVAFRLRERPAGPQLPHQRRCGLPGAPDRAPPCARRRRGLLRARRAAGGRRRPAPGSRPSAG